MKIEISSKSNEKVKMVRKLLSCPKFRQKEGKFAVEGVRLCEEAYQSGLEVTEIFYTEKCYEKSSELIESIVSKNIPCEYIVTEDVMKQMSDTESPQGLVCLCKHIDKRVNMTKIKEYNNIILLENLQNPSNLGSILRSLNAFAVDFVGISRGSCDIYNPKVLRGSMGAVFKLRIMRIDDFPEFLTLLKAQGFTLFAAAVNPEAKNITCLGHTPKKAVILGNEGSGISLQTLSLCDETVTIPMNPSCESLSVAVAAGIVSWEMSGRSLNG